jgi:hypothetical protein
VTQVSFDANGGDRGAFVLRGRGGKLRSCSTVRQLAAIIKTGSSASSTGPH